MAEFMDEHEPAEQQNEVNDAHYGISLPANPDAGYQTPVINAISGRDQADRSGISAYSRSDLPGECAYPRDALEWSAAG
jgi:hypothetical protein